MNTKKLALIVIFTALAIVLGQLIKIPAPYAPFLYYQIWEIPIIVAFILISPWAGLLISLFNTGVLLVIFPGDLPTGPIYNLAAILAMQLGVFIVELMIRKVANKNKEKQSTLIYSPKWVTAATAMGILTRTALMTIVNYLALPQAPPVGFGLPQEVVIAFLPAIAVFNASIALYTIPISYLIANSVKKALRL